MGSEVHLKWSRFGFRSLTFRWAEPQHAASVDKYFMMLLCSSRLFWGGVVRELFFLCGPCTFDSLSETSEGAGMQIQVLNFSCCKSGKQATAVAGKQNGFFPTTRCVCSMPEDKLSLPENTSRSSRQSCCLLRQVQPDVSEVLQDCFPLPQFLPNDQRPHSDSLSHEQSWGSLCPTPVLISACCPPPPPLAFFIFPDSPGLYFKARWGHCVVKTLEVHFAQRRMQSHWRRWCVPERMIES